MSYNLTGPCLLDLQHLVHADFSHMALICISRSTGHLLGAIIGLILLDAVKCGQAMLLLCQAVITGTIFSFLWTRKIDLMVVMVVNGFFLGALGTLSSVWESLGGNVTCLRLWGKDSNPVIQGMHFVFAIGGFFISLTTAPFLQNFSELSPTIDNATYLEGDPLTLADPLYISDNITDSGIHKIVSSYSPFLVVAVSLLAIIQCLITCVIPPTEGDEETTDNSVIGFYFTLCIICCTFFLLEFVVVIGTEVCFAQILTDYAVKGPLHSTSTVGSYVTLAYWGAFTLSRLASVFLVINVGNLILMVANTCIIAVSALVLQSFLPNEWALWLVSILLGVGIASSYASMIGILNTDIHATNKIDVIFTVGAAAGGMSVLATIIYFMERNQEVAFSSIIAASSLVLLLLLFAWYCVLKPGDRSIRVTGHSHYQVVDGARKRESYEMDSITITK